MIREIEHICEVTARRQPNTSYVILTLSCADISVQALPGQFVNISCDQFLRRPFGIMSVDRQKGEFSIGIRIIGEGTLYLSRMQPGQQVSVLGPLGHGFDITGYDRVITVGGGTGVFPLFFLQQYCREQGIEGIAVCGYRSAEESILTEEFTSTACAVSFASDAGDMSVAGHAGLALAQLLRSLRESGSDLSKTLIAACGPKLMMQTTANIASEENLSCQVSLEERMACGIGICLVCACKIKAGEKDWEHQRCCVEGPVFDAAEVIW